MNVNEQQYLGELPDEVPTQDPTSEDCMGKKTDRRDDGTTVFAGYCRAWPGKGTDHVGEGRCKLHGGATPRGEDSPHFEHGLFSDYLSDEDRNAIDGLEEMGDGEKLDELINWRLARLRRYLRQMNDSDRDSFFDKFDQMVQEGRKNGEPGLSAAQIKELAKALNMNNRAAQEEIDLVRKLIKDRNKIVEGEDVNVDAGDEWRRLMGGDG